MSNGERKPGSGSQVEKAGQNPIEIPSEEIERTPFQPAESRARKAPSRRLPSRVIAVWSAGVVLLGLAVFSFTAVPIHLQIDPAPDLVRLPDTWLKFRLGERYLLRSGSHRMIADKEGYYPLSQVIDVQSDSDRTFAFVLTRLPDLLHLDSTPAPAVVAIDGIDVGTTPLEGAEVHPGVHQLTVRAPRHVEESMDLNVDGGGNELRMQVELVPAWAAIGIDSVPGGASIFVDGHELGLTPGTFDLDAGVRQLQLRLDGYNPWSKQLSVEPDVPQVLQSVELIEADARVRISSRPPGAQVIIGEFSPGSTPLELTLASGESHEIRLFLPGYKAAARTVELKPGEEREMTVRLVALMGVVNLVTTPPGATVTVDGREAGSATQQLRLVAATHELVIQSPGYESATRSVTPRADFPQRVEVQLVKLTRASTSSRVVTALGQELRLVEPGRFVMGSPRGEPGHRPNETERPVELTRPYYIGATEVTNREFRQFAPGHRPAPTSGFELGGDDQPVIQVTWRDAADFCNWLSRKESLPEAYVEQGGTLVLVTSVTSGYRLPTEAEWVWAARFAGGRSNSRFPWGPSTFPPPGSGNYADSSAADIVPSALLSYKDGFAVSAPVGRGKANPLGLFDVGGNAAEWVHDRYTIFPNSTGRPAVKDPLGPRYGSLRVIRGSSWKQSSETELRLAYRRYGEEAREDVGFRIARYAH